jgi:hypothetical protein
MSIFSDILGAIGLGPRPDPRTKEEMLADLEQQAKDAELAKTQTEAAWEFKKRIAAANAARQRVIQQASSGKRGLTRGQWIVLGIGLVLLILLFRAC